MKAASEITVDRNIVLFLPKKSANMPLGISIPNWKMD
jgi:hypothetical protein